MKCQCPVLLAELSSPIPIPKSQVLNPKSGPSQVRPKSRSPNWTGADKIILGATLFLETFPKNKYYNKEDNDIISVLNKDNEKFHIHMTEYHTASCPMEKRDAICT